MHWKIYLCTEKYICALKNIFVHWETYLCTGKHICALKNIFLHWETYLCTEKHICALKIYICALKNMSVMCSDQYICTEIFICALHIWATVTVSRPDLSPNRTVYGSYGCNWTISAILSLYFGQIYLKLLSSRILVKLRGTQRKCSCVYEMLL